MSPTLCWVLPEERSPCLFRLGTPILGEERRKGRRGRGRECESERGGGRKRGKGRRGRGREEEVKIGESSVYHYFLTFLEAVDDVLCHYVSEDRDIKHFHRLLEDLAWCLNVRPVGHREREFKWDECVWLQYIHNQVGGVGNNLLNQPFRWLGSAFHIVQYEFRLHKGTRVVQLYKCKCYMYTWCVLTIL